MVGAAGPPRPGPVGIAGGHPAAAGRRPGSLSVGKLNLNLNAFKFFGPRRKLVANDSDAGTQACARWDSRHGRRTRDSDSLAESPPLPA